MLEIGIEWAKEARELILNGGMKRYKERNSKILSMTHKEDKNKKGSIFAFRSKEAMQESRGIVLTSLEGGVPAGFRHFCTLELLSVLFLT